VGAMSLTRFRWIKTVGLKSKTSKALDGQKCLNEGMSINLVLTIKGLRCLTRIGFPKINKKKPRRREHTRDCWFLGSANDGNREKNFIYKRTYFFFFSSPFFLPLYILFFLVL